MGKKSKAALALATMLIAAGTVGAGGTSASTGNPFDDPVWTSNGWPDYSSFDLSGLEIRWADFGGAVHADFRAAYLDPFSELTGVGIVDASPFDYAQVRAQVESGNIQYDIITGAPTSIDEGCGTLYEELPEELFYWDGIKEEYRSSACSVHTEPPRCC